MKLVTDSSTLFLKGHGFEVAPLHIMVDGKDYVEYQDIDSKTLLQKIKDGYLPTSSQPSVGTKADLYAGEGEVLDITMADGLSGTYQSAVMARNMMEDPERVTVFNSRTLCGPHREMLLRAKDMVAEGKSRADIVERLEDMAETDASYLVPTDFNFLKRGGRISQNAAMLGNLLKLVPVLKKSDDGTILNKLCASRTWKKAVANICDDLEQSGKVQDDSVIYICDADNENQADNVETWVRERFPETEIVRMPLSPAFIVQGGPGCISVQHIRKLAD